MPQLNKGDTFADGQQVTGARLNQLVDSATLLPGAIADQTSISENDVQSVDKVMLYDESTSGLRKASVGDIFGANLPISPSLITTSAINAKADKDVIVTPYDGGTNAGISYTATVTSGVTTVSVAHTAHGLVSGQYITITLASNANINGTHKILTVPDVNSFTFKIQGDATAGGGTFTYVKDATLLSIGNLSAINNISAGGEIVANSGNFTGTSSVKFPVGTTIERPSIPAKGMFRYNTTEDSLEFYDGTAWQSIVPKNRSARLALYKSTNNTFQYTTASTWTDIPLSHINETDTFVVNAGSFPNTNTSTITDIILPKGKYTIASTIQIRSAQNNNVNVSMRLYNTTAIQSIVESEIAYAIRGDSSDTLMSTANMMGAFVLTEQSTLRLQYYCNSNTAYYRHTTLTGSHPMFSTLITKIA